MKKYFYIGFSILCLSFFVLFLSLNTANAQTPEPSTTPTATSVIVPMFATPTPVAPGQCPEQPVDPNLDLTYKYREICEHCLMTPTKAFITETPIPEATPTLAPGQPTATNTATATPTKTATPVVPLKSPTMVFSYKGVVKTNLVPEQEYTVNLWSANASLGVPGYAVGEWVTYSFELSPISSTATEPAKSFSYKTGYTFINEIWHPLQYIGLITDINIKVKNLSNKTVTVAWGNGVCNGRTDVLNAQNATAVCTVFDGYNILGQSLNHSNWVDITSETGGLGTKDYTIWYEYVDRVQPNSNGSIDFFYKNGGTFYIPPNPGYCTVPKIQEPPPTSINTIIPVWVGEESCLDLGFVINWINNPVVNTILNTFSNTEVPEVDLPLQVCIRQFYLPSFMFFGIEIDLSYFLYAIASIWAIKSVIGLVKEG